MAIRVTRVVERTPEEQARIQAIRDKFKDHPGRIALLASGEYEVATWEEVLKRAAGR